MAKQKKALKRTFLYIDGTNLFAGQYDLFGSKQSLSFRGLLEDIKEHYPVSRVFFYASYTPRKPKRNPAFFACEALFYRDVRATDDLVFYKGHRSPISGKEKGVDVHLALDMVKDAFLKKYDEAIIMTGDADLIYAVEVTRSLGYPVHAVFIANRFSLELAFKASSSVVLDYIGNFSIHRRFPSKRMHVVKKSPVCKQTG